MIKVLLVDDQEVVREGLKGLLSMEDDLSVVGCAGHGREAINMCETLQPDVVLMDVRMPVCDGVEATREISARYPHIKVLVLTTFDEDEYIHEALAAGASGYLLKDTLSDDLCGAVRVVFHGHMQLGPTIAAKVLARLKPFTKPAEDSPLKFMTTREKEILILVAQGLNNKEIADQLSLSEGTVKNITSNILSHLNVTDRTKAAVWARENGLV